MGNGKKVGQGGISLRWAMGLFCILALLFLVLVLFDQPCLFKAVTGFPCPGCGLTRACLSALKLDFSAAFAWHPLFWLAPPLLFSAVLRQGKLLKRNRANGILWAFVGFLFLIVYGVRMAFLFPEIPPMDMNRAAPLFPLWSGLAR